MKRLPLAVTAAALSITSGIGLAGCESEPDSSLVQRQHEQSRERVDRIAQEVAESVARMAVEKGTRAKRAHLGNFAARLLSNRHAYTSSRLIDFTATDRGIKPAGRAIGNSELNIEFFNSKSEPRKADSVYAQSIECGPQNGEKSGCTMTIDWVTRVVRPGVKSHWVIDWEKYHSPNSEFNDDELPVERLTIGDNPTRVMTTDDVEQARIISRGLKQQSLDLLQLP